ncbi:MAG TPA: hypothetical protein VEY89_06320 [Candidatus Dormibacteraeota bacterium]|nr:hypothetical protein [Candidatus Dormibacteraeota bacterium]
MRDPRVGGEQMLRVARMFELNGDAVGAALAYRHVILGGDERAAREAKQRLELLARRASPAQPV